FVLMLLGAVMAIGPWFVPDATLPVFTKVVLSVAGVAVIMVTGILTIITRLYRKAAANMAFVRTGMGGAKVIKDGGTIVFPVVHQVIPVSLETMRLNVERRGTSALITRDNLRVDLSAEVYINVQANCDVFLQVARPIGV